MPAPAKPLSSDSMAAPAAGIDVLYLQGQVPMAQKAITAYGTDLFGDQINLYDGSLSIQHTDLSLRGNSELSVALTRGTTPGKYERGAGQNKQLGDWSWKLPRIGGTFATPTGWKSRTGTGARCSDFWAPASEMVPGVDGNIEVQSSDFWHGTHLDVPGHGMQEVMKRIAAYSTAPQNGGTYPLLTKNNWQIGCLATIKNGAGEGFYAISPSGVRYDFDWLAVRDTEAVQLDRIWLGRQDVHLYASKVTDRFGNWVKYTYDPTQPLLLKAIEASDGRRIDVTNASGHATSATDGTRTVSYGYSGSTLTTVTLPDLRQWQLNLGTLIPPYPGPRPEVPSCEDGTSYLQPGTFTGTIKHPSGATVEFTTEFILLGTEGAPYNCALVSGQYRLTYMPFNQYLVLKKKEITGPGLAEPLSWAYAYGGGGEFRSVTVTEPDASQTRHRFGNQWHHNEGMLLGVDKGWDGSTAVQSTDTRYRYTYSPYPESFGLSLIDDKGDWAGSRNIPVDQVTTTQQDQTFTSEITSFDALARPLVVTKSGTGGSRSETTAYADNLSLWVLGQIDTVTSNGYVMVDNDYDAKALLYSRKDYGILKFTQTYNADGTLAVRADGATLQTLFSNYKRGIAQNVSYPNGSYESGVVNNIGQITSFTNAASYTTSYGYDAGGRLSSITPPIGFTGTTLVFEPVQSVEYGLAAGHWRHTITKGNAKTIAYFDALWRPVMTRTYDTAKEATTRKVVVKGYDKAGHVAFESYPMRDAATVAITTPGKRMQYDALGRPTRTEADSELGPLVSTTEYLSGFQTRQTNPRNQVTTQTLWALDKPEEALISTIAAPEGVNVSIVRDAFGKPTSITRGGVTRSYVYGIAQRLCKTVEPEVGATIQAYDAAGNIAWRAPGLTLTSTSTCDSAIVPVSAQIRYNYDAVGWLTSTTYGDGSPSVTRTYHGDGKLKSVDSNGTSWSYTYDALRNPLKETLTYAGLSYSFDWAYNAAGDLKSLTYPGSAVTVAYTPNALGEPTMVGSYASAVTFHPNGAVAGYTLGNLIAHSLTQNARGLPLVNSDAGVMKDQYTYDANGNVTGIADQQTGQPSTFSRTMGYDGLDRLTSASAPSVWGSASYTYDAADNLRTANVGVRSVTLNYTDGTNRLNSLTQNGASVPYTYDANGNIRSKGLQTFGFDMGNRLTSSSLGGGYVYDGLGRRVRVQSTDGSTRIHVYSQAGQLLWSTNVGGGRPTSSTAYIHLGGKLIAEVNALSGVQYVHTDALGSPVARSNASATVMNRTRYEPYGYVAQGTKPGPNTSLIGFTGHVQDAETDLVYMQQRYYDPIAGRFLSVDPVVTDASNGKHFGRYHYAENSPFTLVDPDGRAGREAGEYVFGLMAGAILGKENAQLVQKAEASVGNNHAAAGAAIFSEAKRIPSPNGKKGGPEHQAEVKRVGADIERRGLKSQEEFKVDTPGGHKQKRYVDVVALDKKGEVVEMHQVGKQTMGGEAVSRERKAMDDIEAASKMRPQFHPYNKSKK